MTGVAPARPVAAQSVLVLVLILTAFTRNAVWNSSATLWEDAVAKAPNKGRVNYELGRAYGRSGRQDEAFRAMARAKDLDPALFDRSIFRAESLRRQGLFAEAERDYRTRIEGGQDHPVLRNDLGCVLHEARKLGEAHLEFTEAIRQDPNYANAYANRGVVSVEMNDPDAAAGDFRRAVELEPRNSGFRAKLGLALLMLGRYGDAVAAYDEALRLEPGNRKAKEERDEALKRAHAAGEDLR